MTFISARRLLRACIIHAAALAVLAAPSGASATLGQQCSGVNVTGQGANVLKNAHAVWDTDFNTSSSKAACAGLKGQGSLGKPTVSYTTSSAATGLESWGANGHPTATFGVTNAFIGASEPPNEKQKGEIEKFESTATPNTLLSIPTVQTAIAVIVNLPSGCTATSKKDAGRLELNNVTLEGIFRGTITKWSEIKDDGDTISGSGCEPNSPIQPVVRFDQSGTTHIFKKYLDLTGPSAFETEKEESKTWTEISEGTENTVWPKAAHVIKPAAKGGGEELAKVASTPGSIGYANLAEARLNGHFTPSPGTGGPGTASFWAPVQDNGVGTTKLKYADPSSNGDSSTEAEANCKSTEYTNGETAFPPVSVLDPWNEVTTRTTQKKYTLCGLTYDLAFVHYSAFPGTSLGEATTVANYLGFVVNSKGDGGQKLIAGHDYLALPKGKVLEEAQKGAANIAF